MLKHNEISLVRNGEDFLKRTIELIQNAKSFIYLQTYIFEVDTVTMPIILELNQKAKEGLKVKVLLDSFGSSEFPSHLLHSDIEFKFFSPLFSKGLSSVGRRLHSKVLITDFKEAIVGGINLSKRFNKPDDSLPWLDYACLIKGEEVFNLANKLKLHPTSQAQFGRPINIKTNINDWSRFKNRIYKSYIDAIKKSTSEIYITAPYFLPGKKFLKELRCASERGVKVKLIFSAVSDHPMERWCSKYLYSWLLENNIEIYEWEDSIVHGKLAVIDDYWVTIGSYNHNFTSHFGNHELNLEVRDSIFAKTIKEEVLCIKNNSRQITHSLWESSNNFTHKILQSLTYIFANIFTALSLLIISRKKDKSDINLLE